MEHINNDKELNKLPLEKKEALRHIFFQIRLISFVDLRDPELFDEDTTDKFYAAPKTVVEWIQKIPGITTVLLQSTINRLYTEANEIIGKNDDMLRLALKTIIQKSIIRQCDYTTSLEYLDKQNNVKRDAGKELLLGMEEKETLVMSMLGKVEIAMTVFINSLSLDDSTITKSLASNSAVELGERDLTSTASPDSLHEDADVAVTPKAL